MAWFRYSKQNKVMRWLNNYESEFPKTHALIRFIPKLAEMQKFRRDLIPTHFGMNLQGEVYQIDKNVNWYTN